MINIIGNIILSSTLSVVNIIAGVVREGLKMWLPFSKNGNDISGNSNNATLYTGKALSFDGTNDVVSYGSIAIPINTIAFWIKPTAVSNEGLFYLGPSNIPFSFRQISISSGNITATSYFTNFTVYVNDTQTTAVTQDVWQRVVITFDQWTTTVFTVGWAYNKFGAFDISDLQVYNTTWAAADITFDYNNPQHLVTDNPDSSITLSNLKGYWHFSEGAGAIAYDSSGEGNNGTINGATWDGELATIPQLGLMDWAQSTPVANEITLIADPNDPSEDILGNDVRLREHSLNLDGSGYAEVPDDDSFDFGTGDFTLEAWVVHKFENTGSSYNSILSLGGQFSSANSASLVSTIDRFRFYIGTTNVNVGALTTGQWYHLVGVRDNGTMRVYLNAIEKATNTSTHTVTNSNVKNIGRDSLTSRFYKDLIDDARIYNIALTPEQVEQNYNAGKAAHEAGSSFSDDFSSDYGF